MIAFAHAVNRGVGHNGDSFVEVIAQIAADFRERGERAVVTEAGERVFARDHRHQVVHFFFRPAHRGQRVSGGQRAFDPDRALFPLLFNGQRVFGRFVFDLWRVGPLFFVFKVEREET
ncbi:MAG: hypothetical protein JMDDDDMK_04239 [Acidobacteria bacterium]|nr:hypothetical protein [Acidobacteriota bacterium]